MKWDQSTYNILDICISFISASISCVIAVLIYKAAKKIEKQNFSNELKSLWQQIDATVLSDDKLLEAADELIHPDHADESMKDKRKRWICYMLQNAIAITSNGIDNKLMPDCKQARASMNKTLEFLEENPHYIKVKKYCHEGGLYNK